MPGVVVGAVDRPGLDDDDGRPGLDPRLRRDVGEVLRLVVVAEEAFGEVAVVRLVGHPPVGVAEDVDGRDVDDARDAGRDRRIEDALGGVDVGLVHRRPLGRRDADPVRAGDVDDAVGAGHDLAQLRLGAEVAADEPRTDARAGSRRRSVSGSRTIATTSSPRARRMLATRLPMNPVAPVTTTVAPAPRVGAAMPGSVDRRVRSDGLEPGLDRSAGRRPPGRRRSPGGRWRGPCS